jgi:hypothetical protein
MSHSRVTPELRRWVVTQIEAGQTPEAVLESMIGNGWPEGAALDVMERTLRMRVAQIKANENAARAASDSADGAAVGSATADPAGD